MKRIYGILLLAAITAALVGLVACSKGGGDAIVGTWGMVDNPSKTVKITKEGNQYFYEGSQGKSPATKKDDNTLLVPMGPIQVTAQLDPSTKVLSVMFMGERYQYKKVQ